MTRLTRLRRLERLNAARRVATPADTVSIHEELARDDPVRLTASLQACGRADLLDRYPSPGDDSQLARFLRDAWDAGLVTDTVTRTEDRDDDGAAVPALQPDRRREG